MIFGDGAHRERKEKLTFYTTPGPSVLTQTSLSSVSNNSRKVYGTRSDFVVQKINGVEIPQIPPTHHRPTACDRGDTLPSNLVQNP